MATSGSHHLLPPAAASANQRPTVRGRPMPRKGHTKSRKGCLTCKSRKVKCDESTPACGSCGRLGLACQYPSNAAHGSDDQRPMGSVGLRKSLQSSPTAFSLENMSFFHHFLLSAYPTLPIGGWSVWQEVGRMSHCYEFLVHAMLGLGASHLGLLNDRGYVKEALNHRVLAIKGLNERIAKGKLSTVDGDAAFAAMLALTFQSGYMSDGMTDFFSLVRGCYIIGSSLIPDFEVSTFKTFARESYVQKVQEIVNAEMPNQALGSSVASGLLTSLRRLGPLCRSVPELEYLARLQKIVTSAATNPTECYQEHSFLYDKFGELSSEEFTAFLDPQNHVSRLIILHLLALEFVMSRKEVEIGDKMRVGNDIQREGYDCRKNMAMDWIMKMLASLPQEYCDYAGWLANFVRGLPSCTNDSDEIWQPFLSHSGTATTSDIYQSDELELVY